ncbi:M56 family metallopeptidase [Streptomyces sp. YIM 98790]|uniref:M56 family metallopeptidase n=1 Tax=Streptomyces sp. YIM 98790 TaxID=2689077 RepID=UPI00140D7E51|nr:M56 family metallopeptidase [Streptomyces sp. YIM 98790]
MRIAVLLLGYATVLAVLAPMLLARPGWTARAPKLGIWAWQAVTATVIASVALAGLALAVPTVPVSGSLAEMLHACVMALRAQYAVPGGAAAAASGTALAVAVAGRTGWCLGAAVWRARRERVRHAAVLAMVGRARPDLGVTVLDDDRPAAYCLPGHGHRIVLTTAALAALDPRELGAVIAHERAHIRQRHHLVLAYVEAMERAFPGLPLFRLAAQETRRLVELAADDAATARTGSLTLAGALVGLAGAGAPAASLAASGGHVAGRVHRLLGPRRPVRRAVAWGGALTAGVLLAVPFVLAAQPAVAATGMSTCPLPDDPVAAAEPVV